MGTTITTKKAIHKFNTTAGGTIARALSSVALNVLLCSTIASAAPGTSCSTVQVRAAGDQLKIGDVVQSGQEVLNHKLFQVDKVRVEAPKECVWAILTNYPDAPRVYSKITTCKVLVDEGANKVVAFKVKAFKDLVTLDYSLNVQEHFPSSIEWSRHDGAFKANEGYWHIDSTDNNKSCIVTYAKFINAGGFQQFFVTKELKADMPQILASVKTSAETFYQNILHESEVKPRTEGRSRAVSYTSRKLSSPDSQRVTETTTITLKTPAGSRI
jgi:uncharacterized membrane protein